MIHATIDLGIRRIGVDPPEGIESNLEATIFDYGTYPPTPAEGTPTGWNWGYVMG